MLPPPCVCPTAIYRGARVVEYLSGERPQPSNPITSDMPAPDSWTQVRPPCPLCLLGQAQSATAAPARTRCRALGLH